MKKQKVNRNKKHVPSPAVELTLEDKKAKPKDKYPCLIIEADGTISVSEINFGGRAWVAITSDDPRGWTVRRILDAGGRLQLLTYPQTDKPYAIAVLSSGVSDELAQVAVNYLSLGDYPKEWSYEQRRLLERWRQGQVFLRIKERASEWSMVSTEPNDNSAH